MLTTTLRGKRIFIVEDNEDNIFVLLTSLRQHGAEVQIDWWAKGDRQALAKSLPIDLIILDLMLPGGRTGFDIFDEIRQNTTLDHIPVVAVSAMDPSIALPKVRDQGFAGFISKPIDINLFPQQIAALIAGENVWHAE